MKIALIAAGTLAAATLAGLSGASAKDANFALTVGGPQGYVQIGTPGGYDGPYYPYEAHPKKHKKKRHAKKHAKRYWNGNPGNGYGYWGPYPRPRVRAQGYCMRPYQIRNKLHRHGWYGLNVRKRTSQFLVFTGFRHGAKYRLKVDRCNGYIAKAKPVGGYQYGIYR